ncbi:MAG: helix-turn-helix transcriptional regulator [Alphaproteobacteria bacterium]|nr:helix-turn-helix transcriptional regulator [Alphaproteobacteria bacterium]
MSPLLIKAARVLLDWQQTDLARASGISLTAVKAYEKSTREVRPRTVEALQAALERGGIEFLPSGGLRRTEDVVSVTRYSGPDFTRRLNEELYASIRGPQDEIMTSSADEGMWRMPSLRKANEEYLEWCEKTGMLSRHRMLVPEGNAVFMFPRQVYRTLPPELLGKIGYTLYADKLAFILWKKRQVIVLRNKAVVETFRSQFLYLWRLAKSV